MLVINCLIVNNKNVHKNFKIQDMSNIRIRSRPTLLLAILSIFSLLIMLWNNSLKEYEIHEYEVEEAIARKRRKTLDANFLEAIKGAQNISQDDPKLIEFIRNQYLNPPSKMPYRMKIYKHTDPSHWQAKEVLKILNEKRNGFFVEAGAFDGEFYSNTLHMERKYGWEGVLVEPSFEYLFKIKSKNRKAWFVPACLSPSSHPIELDLKFADWASYLVERKGQGDQLVQCFPLYSILLAVNRTKIDYLSLDVEKIEVKVLKFLPWNKIQIKVITVENQYLSKEEDSELLNLMANLGYKELDTYPVNPKGLKVIDYLFYHPSYIKNK